jgi:hypothetical protein
MQSQPGCRLSRNARVDSESIPANDGLASNPGLALRYDLKVDSVTTGGGAIAEALWEGNILAGAVADEYTARDFGKIRAAIGTLVTADGTR